MLLSLLKCVISWQKPKTVQNDEKELHNHKSATVNVSDGCSSCRQGNLQRELNAPWPVFRGGSLTCKEDAKDFSSFSHRNR